MSLFDLLAAKSLAGGSGGGGDVFWVTFTFFSRTGTADKTFAEILSAVNAGKFVVAKYDMGSETAISFAYYQNCNRSGGMWRLRLLDTINSNVEIRTCSGESIDSYPSFNLV